jgi:hypothetical protein
MKTKPATLKNTLASPTRRLTLPIMPSDEEWSDAEELAGGPIVSSAAAGVRKMTLRVKVLEERISRCRDWIAKGADVAEFEADEVRLIQEIREARQRLAQYQAQLDGRN